VFASLEKTQSVNKRIFESFVFVSLEKLRVWTNGFLKVLGFLR
jgi:hypothetical protein